MRPTLEPARRARAIMRRVRTALVALIALLVIVQVVRNALVMSYGSAQPRKAAAIWPSHPDIIFKTALEDIAAAAANGNPVPMARIEAIYAAARKAPLAPEPFLVRGIQARNEGKERLAGQAFEAARKRAPRSLAAHYFLADHYLKTGQTDAGLAELARLTRLVPDGITSVAPYYASYAKAPGGAKRVKAMLRSNPQFEPQILAALAGDSSNADLILYLARGQGQPPGQFPAWHGRLVESLLAAGRYAKARQVWARLSGQPISSGVFDPGFSGKLAPPPFNWTLLSDASGVAEGIGEGRLHVIYYGRDNATLATQTLTLAPGRYLLSFNVQGNAEALAAITWKITCRPAGRPLLSLGLVGSQGRRGGEFVIAPGCGAQQLSLIGISPDFPETVDLIISSLSLSRVGV